MPEEQESKEQRRREIVDTTYYFAYGSNMNLNQMKFRCPDAAIVGNVALDGYRLKFRGRQGCGYATIVPQKDSRVEGVLWKLTTDCERNLDIYEGYPSFYDKETIVVREKDGTEWSAMVYIMSGRLKDQPAEPSEYYLRGILEGCHQNGIPTDSVLKALKETKAEIREMRKQNKRYENAR